MIQLGSRGDRIARAGCGPPGVRTAVDGPPLWRFGRCEGPLGGGAWYRSPTEPDAPRGPRSSRRTPIICGTRDLSHVWTSGIFPA